MWPILIWFLVGLAIVLERSIYFWLTRSGRLDSKTNASNQAPAARLQQGARQMNATGLALAENRSRLQKIASSILEDQERRLAVLPILAATAPLLGLLGTIAGIMQAFRAVELAGGAADIAVFAGGIWPALLTTASGLTVAVSLHISHGLLNHQVNQRLKGLNATADQILERWQMDNPAIHCGSNTDSDEVQQTKEFSV